MSRLQVLARVSPARAWLARLGGTAARRHGVLRGRLLLARKRATQELGRWLAGGRRRSLVTEILAVQLAVTALIGLGAIAGLAWTSSVLVQNNLLHWAHQWAGDLNELGAPFYLRDEASALVNVERFVAKYPEIAGVTWYRPDGSVLASLGVGGAPAPQRAPLESARAAELKAMVRAEQPYLLRETLSGARRFRLSGPIWREEIIGDGLYDLSPGSAETLTELYGFVAVDLDFSPYRSEFLPRLVAASAALLVLLGATWAGGRVLLKRALRPLADLQQPLAKLASGSKQIVFPATHHQETASIVAALADTTRALRERESRLLHLATHDPLTGLHNRHRFMDELTDAIARAARARGPSARLVLDHDQLKYVNDTCGHPAGDHLLKLAAQRIHACVPHGDLTARFGGDEFVVLLKEAGRRDANTVADQILEELRSLSYVEQERVLYIQGSIGIAMIHSARYAAHEVLAQADIACREAKASGRNRKEIYKISKGQSERLLSDMGWAGSIREALEKGSFELHYQPIMQLRSRRIRHHEALLRLRTEAGELVAPEMFLPAAIRFGLMPDIDRWVVEHALRALARFRAEEPALGLSINLSPFAFEGPDLATRVRRQLKEHDLPGDAVIFEITEQLAVRFALNTDKQMGALRDLGCRFALDDFGTGYSSFSYLKRLPVDYLKIDGSFIRNLPRDRVDQRMVRMIAEVAHASGMETIAEYVQSAAILRLLARYGIDYAQGFHIGRPVPVPAGVGSPA